MIVRPSDGEKALWVTERSQVPTNEWRIMVWLNTTSSKTSNEIHKKIADLVKHEMEQSPVDAEDTSSSAVTGEQFGSQKASPAAPQIHSDETRDHIENRCPACGWKSLFIGSGGWLTCGNLDCEEPVVDDAIQLLLAKEQTRLLDRVLEELQGPKKTNSMYVEGYTDCLTQVIAAKQNLKEQL